MLIDRYNVFSKDNDASFKKKLRNYTTIVLRKKIYKRFDGFERFFVRTAFKKKLDNWIDGFMAQNEPPLFTGVEIETINRCNGTCSFCPANKNTEVRPYAKMTDEMFYSIVAQLKALNYKGLVGLSSNNEPFLDNRIIDFAKHVRQELPEAEVVLYTNGTLLTLEKFLDIMPSLNQMVIDNYSDDLKLFDNVKEIHEHTLKDRTYYEKVEIHIRKQTEVLSTRAGQSPNNKKQKTLDVSCTLPYLRMTIRPDGKISLCCNDAQGKLTLGDLEKQSLVEIWRSETYKGIRQNLRNGRKFIPLCEFCDHTTYMV